MGLLELLGVALAAVIGAFFYGRSAGRDKEKRKLEKDHIDAAKRMGEVTVDGDPGVLRDWLRERGE